MWNGVFVTQSFVDELFGPMILRIGPAVLQRLAFSGCNDETKAISINRVEQIVYGDDAAQTDGPRRNARGRPLLRRDAAGTEEVLAYDPDGRILRVRRFAHTRSRARKIPARKSLW